MHEPGARSRQTVPASTPTAVFVHGLPGPASAWRDVVADLEPAIRCHTPNLPGFADTPSPARLGSLADFRAATATILDALDLPGRFALVVHDVGALFGLAWAAAQPHRLSHLVVLNCGVFPERRLHWGARLLRWPGIGELAMRALPWPGFHAEMRRASNGNLEAAAIREIFRDFTPPGRRTALGLYRVQSRALLAELAQALHRLSDHVPTCVIWGAADPYLPARFAHSFGARQVQLDPDLGHWPHREAPARVAADIRAFLAASPGSRRR